MASDARADTPDLRLEMLSRPKYLAAARTMIGHVAQRLGFDEVQCGQIALAVDEVLCNVIKHGYESRDDGPIWIAVYDRADDADGPAITIVIEDEARQVDPERIRSRDLDEIRPGGLGVHIIREVMDEVRYERRPRAGMRVTLTKFLHRPAVSTTPEGDAAR